MRFSERITCYCQEQLEPGSRLFLSVIVTLFIQLLISGLNWSLLVPALSTFLLLLYYRISDEIKDQKTDAAFFPDRPLPSGRLLLSDLKFMMIIVSAAGLLLNLIFPSALKEFIIAFLFTIAMGKWFFLEKWISNNRLIAFFTHAPVGIFLYWYAESYLLNNHGVSWNLAQRFSVIGFIVLPGLSWEILRKTYLPQDELPGYQVYSTMLGFKGSLFFASAWVLLTLLNDLFLINQFAVLLDGLTIPLVVINLLLMMVVANHALNPQMKNLKPVAEIYMALHLLVPLALILYRLNV